MLTERTIINALILTATFVLAPFLIAESLTQDFIPALIAGGIFVVIVAFFFVKEKLSAAPLLGASVLGSINFLPIPLGGREVAAIALILYYITGYVLMTQRPITVGKPIFFWPILIVTGIVLYHVHTLSFGSLGGSKEGAKPAFMIYLFTLAYFCGINLPTPSVYFFSRIPLYTVVLTVLSCIPYLLSTYIPALAPYFYSVTDNVNVEAYVNTEGGTQDVGYSAISSRLASFGPISAVVQLYLLAHYPIGTWFNPKRLWVVLVSLICLALAVMCGYRSNLFSYFFMIFMGVWCYYSWRAIFLPAIGFVGLLVFITAADNNLIHVPLKTLPIIAQRTMSFLPGDWDEEATRSAASSNLFRQNIIDVYLAEFAWQHPLIGNGFEIDTDQFTAIETTLDSGHANDVMYLQAKLFIIGKMFHTGWISVYDCIGIIGWGGYLWFQCALVFVTGRFLFARNADRKSALFPLYVWLHCSVTTGLVTFYTVFGSVSSAFNDGLCFTIVIMHLCKLQKQNELASAPGERKSQVEFSGISQTNYGNKYY